MYLGPEMAQWLGELCPLLENPDRRVWPSSRCSHRKNFLDVSRLQDGGVRCSLDTRRAGPTASENYLSSIRSGTWELLSVEASGTRHTCAGATEAQGGQTEAEGNHTKKTTDSQGSLAKTLKPQEGMRSHYKIWEWEPSSDSLMMPGAWRNRLAV